jgi:hypothetical protein
VVPSFWGIISPVTSHRVVAVLAVRRSSRLSAAMTRRRLARLQAALRLCVGHSGMA